MADISVDLRRRLVAAYQAKKSGTYAATAALFGVGEATVSRLLRRHRETGDVLPKPRGGNNPRRIDLEWLRGHLEAHPDARLIDRIEAWKTKSGVEVAIGTMWLAVRDCGWTHKKRPNSRENSIGPTSNSSETRSSSFSPTSTRRS